MPHPAHAVFVRSSSAARRRKYAARAVPGHAWALCSSRAAMPSLLDRFVATGTSFRFFRAPSPTAMAQFGAELIERYVFAFSEFLGSLRDCFDFIGCRLLLWQHSGPLPNGARQGMFSCPS